MSGNMNLSPERDQGNNRVGRNCQLVSFYFRDETQNLFHIVVPKGCLSEFFYKTGVYCPTYSNLILPFTPSTHRSLRSYSVYSDRLNSEEGIERNRI